MFDAMAIGATAMQAQQIHIDTIANNVANASTPGYRRGRVSFTDLVAQGAAAIAAQGADGVSMGVSMDAPGHSGVGVAIAALSRQFDAGSMQKTGSPYDVAIDGAGFLEVVMPDGARGFIRGGSLKVNREGLLATHSGLALKPGIAIADDVKSLSIASDGVVQVTSTSRATPSDAGQLELVRFINPQGLVAQGDGVYRASEASGEAIAGKPGEGASGLIEQGVLEGSNVKMIDEMIELMVAQRAYEANVKIVQAADDMLGMINGLRK